MRILHFSDSFWPRTRGIGGIQIWLTHLARQQVAEKHHVAIATWSWENAPRYELWHGIEVWRWPVSEAELIHSPKKMFELRRTLQTIRETFRPDVVHVHLNQLACWVNTLGESAAPAIVTHHVPVAHNGLPLKLQHQVLAHADAIVAPSAHVRTSLAQRYPAFKGRLLLAYYGLELPAIATQPEPTAPYTFLCLGRIVSEKGFDVALRAFAFLARADCRLVVAGDGPALASLRQLARDLGLTGQVEFCGWVQPDEVPALLNRCSVLLVPSLWEEPFGLVALQAAQMGRPVIASKMGGLPEIVKDGVTGRIIPAGNPEALGAAMRELMENPGQRTRLGRQASTRVRERFSISSCAAAYFSIYQEYAARKSSPTHD